MKHKHLVFLTISLAFLGQLKRIRKPNKPLEQDIYGGCQKKGGHESNSQMQRKQHDNCLVPNGLTVKEQNKKNAVHSLLRADVHWE